MQFAFRACAGKTVPGTNEPACITRVHRYPLTSMTPQFYTYIGKFGPDVANAIKKQTDEVSSTETLPSGR